MVPFAVSVHSVVYVEKLISLEDPWDVVALALYDRFPETIDVVDMALPVGPTSEVELVLYPLAAVTGAEWVW